MKKGIFFVLLVIFITVLFNIGGRAFAEEACQENPPLRFENFNRGWVIRLHGTVFVRGEDGSCRKLNQSHKIISELIEGVEVPIHYIVLGIPHSNKTCIYILHRVREVNI